MQFHLYRPMTWARGGACHAMTDTRDLRTYDQALLLRLKRATFLPPHFIFGDVMSDDRSSALRLVTAPASEPLTLAQAKTFLRIEHSADDEPIGRAITAARQAAEQYLKTALLPQTWDYVVANPLPTKLHLPFGPAQSITSITLTTESGATSTMNAANYRLSVSGFSIFFDPSVSIEKLTVRYVAGIAVVVSDIPLPIVQGMLHHIAVMMENRDGDAELPVQSIRCYQPYRRISL